MSAVHRFFSLLNRSPVRVPDRAYYWLLDRLTDSDGWRPLSQRGHDRRTSPNAPMREVDDR